MTGPAGLATASPGTASPGTAGPGHCERHGASLPDPAIQFPLRHPALVSVVSGMRSGGQVASTLARFATVVRDEAWTELDAC